MHDESGYPTDPGSSGGRRDFSYGMFCEKKHSSAIGFISAGFAKHLQFDYDELENFVASILDTEGCGEADGYAYHGYRIFVEKL